MSTQKAKEGFPVQNDGGVIKSQGTLSSLNPVEPATNIDNQTIISPPVAYLTSPPFTTLDIGNENNEAYRGNLIYYTESLSGIKYLTQEPLSRSYSQDIFIMESGRAGNNVDGIYYFVGSPQRNQYEERFFVTPTPNYNEVALSLSSLTYSYGDFDFVLTGRGLTQIKLSGVPIASGGIYAHNVATDFGVEQTDEWFTDERDVSDISYHYNTRTSAIIPLKELTQYTVNGQLSRAIVKHTYNGSSFGNSVSGVIVYHQYTFSGSDVEIISSIDNQSSNYISIPSVGGLDFYFDRPPQGIFAFGELSSVQPLGPINASVKDYQTIEVGYRGNRTQHFVSSNYATDSKYGVSVTPWKNGPHRQSLFLSAYRMGQEDSETKRTLEYFRYVPINPGGRQSTRLKLRIGSNDWRTLLAPYKEEVLYTHGALKYNTTNWKFFIQNVIDNDRDGFGAQNPYALQQGYRFDKASDTQDYINAQLNTTYSGGLSAAVYWNLEGRHPREGTYRMEHDVMPPEVSANLNTLRLALSGQNISWGTSTNIRNFNAQKNYHGLNRYTFTGPNQTQEVPMRLHFMDVRITQSGVPRQLSKTLSSDVDAGNYGAARYSVSGNFTGTITLQYYANGTWNDSTTTTTPTSADFDLYRPNEYVNTKWRFAAKNWTAGTGYCRIHTRYSSDNSFNFMLSPKYSAYSGVAYLEYKDIPTGNWTTWSEYKGQIFTGSGQSVQFSAVSGKNLFVHYVTPSGWAGKLILEYNPAGTWTSAPNTSAGNIRQRDVAATEQTALYLQYDNVSVTGWRMRTENTWLSTANAIFGHWKDEGLNALTVDIIPTDWRVRTGTTFSGILYSVMYEDNMIDFLSPPAQVTRSVTNVDFDAHYNKYKARFQNVFNSGMNYFYADTVSRYYDDFPTLRLLREELGTNWQFIPEYYNDYMLPYGGTYTTCQAVRSPIGTRQTRTLNSGNQTFSTPYPVFVAPLFTTTLTGSFSGSIYLQAGSGSVWTNVRTYSSGDLPVSEEIPSSGSYLNNLQWRLTTSSGYSGSVAAILADNLGRDSNGTSNQTYIVGYNENDLVASYSISSSGSSPKPTPYFRGTLGPVLVHLQGSSWNSGLLHIEKYNNGWELVRTYSGVPSSVYEEFPITQDENWRYRTNGLNSSITLTMGQWRSKVPGYITEVFRYIYGSGIESVVKLGTEMPTSAAPSYYNFCFRNGFKPVIVAGYEASGLAIQRQYIASDGSRI